MHFRIQVQSKQWDSKNRLNLINTIPIISQLVSCKLQKKSHSLFNKIPYRRSKEFTQLSKTLCASNSVLNWHSQKQLLKSHRQNKNTNSSKDMTKWINHKKSSSLLLKWTTKLNQSLKEVTKKTIKEPNQPKNIGIKHKKLRSNFSIETDYCN